MQHISQYKTKLSLISNCRFQLSCYGMQSISLNSCGNIEACNDSKKKESHARGSMVRTCSEPWRGRDQLQTAASLSCPSHTSYRSVHTSACQRTEVNHFTPCTATATCRHKPNQDRWRNQKPERTHIQLHTEENNTAILFLLQVSGFKRIIVVFLCY